MPEPIKWQAYCLTCRKAIGMACPNGLFVEGDAKRHLQVFTDHVVLVGYIVDSVGQESRQSTDAKNP